MADSQLQLATDLARRELHPSWAAVAVVVLALAVRLVLEGTASAAELATIAAYTGVVVATALVRVRQWAGIWFVWAALALHFANTLSAVGVGLPALVLVVAAGVLVVLGVQDVRGALER